MTLTPEREDVLSAGPEVRDYPGLPMANDIGLLTHPERRPRVIREHRGRFPFPVPNGWFIVAMSEDLGPKSVVPIYCFGRELVIFRAEDGTPRAFDAHCPHMGAHLGVGGRVEGDCLRCPFHGWKFDGESGQCTEIPYDPGATIPRKASVRSYPTLERNRAVWVWYHAEGKEPFYDIPEVPEFDDPDWHEPTVRTFAIRICAQEMAENNVDRAHFRYVHGTDAIPEEEFVVDGCYKRAVGLNGKFVREGYGLGLGILRMEGFATWISSTTPIDEDNVVVRWIFTAPRSNGLPSADHAADSFCSGVSQDIPIWENKVYRDKPLLRAMEADVTEHRLWSQQFYSYPEGAGTPE
jgi:phenylpropionate dioxygenase-like ring-hydroxylating dioxygenase large terminal subunit